MEKINFQGLPSTDTPINPDNLNKMQSNIEEKSSSLNITSDTTAGATITIPSYYKVGQGTLDVYINGERLLLSSDDTGTDGHYREVGDANSISNQIKLTTDWNASSGDYFEFVVRGEYSVT